MSVKGIGACMTNKLDQYRNGGEGFGAWAEDYLYVPIYPQDSVIPVWTSLGDLPDDCDEYGRSYKRMWEAQKEICCEALQMENGRFKHRLIIFCWPRGEGKSLVIVMMKLWRFFCWPRMQIILGANSKDQIKFVHYEIMTDIVRNSPDLYRLVGEKNIQEKEMRFRDKDNKIGSKLRTISSFTGILSNITGYTFSEIFDMKQPKFFVQLDGSLRGIPNAFGAIDSTVSSKQHILYQLFENASKTTTTYFSYRCSQTGNPADYWNPNMTKAQLDDYRIKFPLGDFERYFLNLWSAGAEKVFSSEQIEAWRFFGVQGRHDHTQVIELLTKKNQIIEGAADKKVERLKPGEIDVSLSLQNIDDRLWAVEDVYRLRSKQDLPMMATIQDLYRLSDLYDTDWVIGAGIDRADPMKIRTGARTVMAFTAKGLPSSRSSPRFFDQEGAVPNFVYVLLHLVHIEDHSIERMKEIALAVHSEFNGLDMIAGERWGIWDLSKWCEDQDIAFEAVYPSYDRQKEAFTAFYQAVNFGRFKAPPLAVPGSKMGDILFEEASIFDHDPDRKWFGSPEKNEKYGIQDDAIYSVAWSFFGLRLMTLDDFRVRHPTSNFGLFINPTGRQIGIQIA